MKWLDLPPVWLVLFIGLVWGLTVAVPMLMFTLPGHIQIALLLLTIGLVLMVAAAFEMYRARTTIIPRRNPAKLVTSGIFRYSRNPIYLGDAFILAAAVIWMHILPALILVPFFTRVIQTRFIIDEEVVLKEAFGDEFENWKDNTRRWI